MAKPTVPIRCTKPQLRLFIPRCAGPCGTSDCYESMPRTPIRGWNPEGWGEGNVVRSKTSRGEGLVPRWARDGAWRNPPCQFAAPNHNSGFSYLGVPAPAGMSDCYESLSRATLRDRPLQHPLIGHSRHPFVIPAPHFVTPAPHFVTPAPHSSFRPPIRHSGEGRNPEGVGRDKTTNRWKKTDTSPHFHPSMRPSQGHGESGDSALRTPILALNPREGVWESPHHRRA